MIAKRLHVGWRMGDCGLLHGQAQVLVVLKKSSHMAGLSECIADVVVDCQILKGCRTGHFIEEHSQEVAFSCPWTDGVDAADCWTPPDLISWVVSV